jgi:type IV pilus assembly protein PilO
MTKLKQLWMLTAMGSVAVLALGWFLLVTPKADQAAAVRAETETQLAANQQLQSKINMLTKQKKDKPKLQGELDAFARLIPSNPALPALVRALSDAAEKTDVDLVSVSPGNPALAAGAAPGTVATTSSGLTLAQIPVAIKIAGKYSQISQFVAEVEGLNRAFMVNGLKIAPGVRVGPAATSVDDGTLRAELSGQMFMTTAAPQPVTPVAAPAPDAS